MLHSGFSFCRVLKRVSGICCTALAGVGALAAAEVFHFDFADANGKTQLTSGKVLLQSHRVPLLVERKSLRLAVIPEITISGVPALTEQFSVSAWVLSKKGRSNNPILSRGINGNGSFFFTTGGELYTQRKHVKSGISYGNRLPAPDKWHQLTAVFDKGSYKMYIDGKLFSSAKGTAKLPASKEPLLVGVIGNDTPGTGQPFTYSDMLLNDLRLWDHPLSAAEVKSLYDGDRKKYPAASQAPVGRSIWEVLDPCFHYAPEGLDPDFRKVLPLTQKYDLAKCDDKTPVRTSRMVGKKDSAPRMFLNDKEYMPYMSFGGFVSHDVNNYRAAGLAARDFGAAGVKLRRVSIHMGNHPTMKDMIWLGYGKYDFSILDKKLEAIIKGDPGAKLDIYISLHYTPLWFRTQHPEESEVLMMPNGQKVRNYTGQLGSDIYKKYGERWVKDLITYVEKSPYAGKVFCYTITGGMSREWYWPGTFSGGMPGYSKPTLQLFRKWLKKRYPDAKAMQKAWNDPKVTPETAQVPLPAVRQASETLLLRDPEKCAPAVDFRRFINDRTFECLRDLAKVAKEACGGRKLIGTYSGYSFGNDIKEHLSGTSIFNRVVRLKECDFTQLAIVYNYGRLPGGAGVCVNPYNGSSMLHGKLLWHEADLRTSAAYAATGVEWYRRHRTHKETAAMIERNLAFALTKGNGLYECPMFGMAAYHEKTIQQGVKNAADVASNVKSLPRRSAAEIAVVFDAESALYLPYPNNKNRSYFNRLLYFFNCDAPKAGVPIDFYTMEDLKEPGMKDYKLYFFPNAVSVTPAQREIIQKKLARNGAAAVWCLAPGYISNGKFDLQGMKALTGMDFKVERKNKPVAYAPNGKSPLFKYKPANRPVNCDPVFVPAAKGMTVHAFADGKAALTELKKGKQRTFYSLLPLDHKLLRGIAEYCGVHIWLNTEDSFDANENLVVIHAASAGEKTLKLPRKAVIRDARTMKVLQNDTDTFKVKLDKFENSILIIE